MRNEITLESKQRLRTFSAANATPDDAYNASIQQLKQLILVSNSYTTSRYNIIWQTALLYAANGMLHSRDEDRLEYFLICIYSFRRMRHCFRITVSIAQAILATAMQQGVISGTLASMIIADLRARAPDGQEPGERPTHAPLIADLDSVMTDPAGMSVVQLAGELDDSYWINRYTGLFNEASQSVEPKPLSSISEVTG